MKAHVARQYLNATHAISYPYVSISTQMCDVLVSWREMCRIGTSGYSCSFFGFTYLMPPVARIAVSVSGIQDLSDPSTRRMQQQQEQHCIGYRQKALAKILIDDPRLYYMKKQFIVSIVSVRGYVGWKSPC